MELLRVEVARNHEVEVGVELRPRAPGAEPVRVDPLGRALRLERSRELLQQRRVRLVHQPADRLLHQAEPLPQDVRGHGQRDHRVEPDRAGEAHGEEPHQHPAAGPDVGQHMAPVGDERERAGALADAEQVEAEPRIQQARAGEQREAQVESFGGAAAHEPAHGLRRDQQRGHDDQRPLHRG